MPSSRALIQSCAIEVARDCGMESFPFEPKIIAEKSGISVDSQPDMHGATGAIFLTDDPVIYHPKHLSDGLLNFTIGHELGHYFLSGHPEQIIEDGGMHFSRGGVFSMQKPVIEQEADYFSASLLMPARQTEKLLNANDVGLHGILRLHKIARTSITSSAIRAVQCDPYPIAMVMVKSGGEVEYSFRSSSFQASVPGKHLSRGENVPSSSAAFRISLDSSAPAGERELEQSDSRTWFGEGNKRLEVETYHLGRHGTLVVLSGEENWEDDEEEADLLDSWTPKFKR